VQDKIINPAYPASEADPVYPVPFLKCKSSIKDGINAKTPGRED
jgi:hypothetical protein